MKVILLLDWISYRTWKRGFVRTTRLLWYLMWRIGKLQNINLRMWNWKMRGLGL